MTDPSTKSVADLLAHIVILIICVVMIIGSICAVVVDSAYWRGWRDGRELEREHYERRIKTMRKEFQKHAPEATNPDLVWPLYE